MGLAATALYAPVAGTVAEVAARMIEGFLVLSKSVKERPAQAEEGRDPLED